MVKKGRIIKKNYRIYIKPKEIDASYNTHNIEKNERKKYYFLSKKYKNTPSKVNFNQISFGSDFKVAQSLLNPKNGMCFKRHKNPPYTFYQTFCPSVVCDLTNKKCYGKGNNVNEIDLQNYADISNLNPINMACARKQIYNEINKAERKKPLLNLIKPPDNLPKKPVVKKNPIFKVEKAKV